MGIVVGRVGGQEDERGDRADQNGVEADAEALDESRPNAEVDGDADQNDDQSPSEPVIDNIVPTAGIRLTLDPAGRR